MTVIAMTREMGTLGKDVAQGLADQLGLKVVHHELVERDLAQQLGAPESTVHRFLEGSVSLLEKWKMDGNRLARCTAEEIFKLAEDGNVVIRGWGAAALLNDVSSVLCVRVCAPMAFREQVMMERLGVADPAVVRREIELNDAAHARVMTGLFSHRWDDPLNYHAVLNSSVVSVDNCVALLRGLAESAAFQETAESRAMISDKLLKARVRSALMTSVEHGAGSSSVEVSVQKGVVAVSGLMFEQRVVDEIIQTVQAVAGVLKVENRITVTHLRRSGQW